MFREFKYVLWCVGKQLEDPDKDIENPEGNDEKISDFQKALNDYKEIKQVYSNTLYNK